VVHGRLPRGLGRALVEVALEADDRVAATGVVPREGGSRGKCQPVQDRGRQHVVGRVDPERAGVPRCPRRAGLRRIPTFDVVHAQLSPQGVVDPLLVRSARPSPLAYEQ
jgi:hypothetical protein